MSLEERAYSRKLKRPDNSFPSFLVIEAKSYDLGLAGQMRQPQTQNRELMAQETGTAKKPSWEQTYCGNIQCPVGQQEGPRRTTPVARFWRQFWLLCLFASAYFPS